MKTSIQYLTGAFLGLTLLSACKKDSPDEERPPQGSPYISKVFEYRPAPGQWINTGASTQEGVNRLIGSADGFVSLGAWGGYIVFGFDHAVENKAGHDLGIYSNVIFSKGLEWSEPGIVLVMKDKNGNGLPDDGEWYELAGSEYSHGSTIRTYQITYFNPKSEVATDIRWEDNQGNSGFVKKNQFHTQTYFPAWAAGEESVSFEGSLLRNNFKLDGILTSLPFGWGYTDSGSPELIRLAGEEGRGYNSFDIDWAVNSRGEKVQLSSIDFVKVYTAQNSDGMPTDLSDSPVTDRGLGEISTEISGAIDIHLFKKK